MSIFMYDSDLPKYKKPAKMNFKDLGLVILLGGAMLLVRYFFLKFASGPYILFMSQLIEALIFGPAYMTMMALIKKNGPVIIISAVTAIIFYREEPGYFFLCIVMGALAEMFMKLSAFENCKLLNISFVFYNMTFFGSLLPLFTKEPFRIIGLSKKITLEHLSLFEAIANTRFIILIIAFIALCSIISGTIGFYINKKRFEASK